MSSYNHYAFGLDEKQVLEFQRIWNEKDYYRGDQSRGEKSVWGFPFEGRCSDLPRNKRYVITFTNEHPWSRVSTLVDNYYKEALHFIVREVAEQAVKHPEQRADLYERAQKLRRDAVNLELDPQTLLRDMLDSLEAFLKPNEKQQQLLNEFPYLEPVCLSKLYLGSNENLTDDSNRDYKQVENADRIVAHILKTDDYPAIEHDYSYVEETNEWYLHLPEDADKAEEQQILQTLKQQHDDPDFRRLFGGTVYMPDLIAVRDRPARDNTIYLVQSDDAELAEKLLEYGKRMPVASSMTAVYKSVFTQADDQLASLLRDDCVKIFTSLQNMVSRRSVEDKDALLLECQQKQSQKTEVKRAQSAGRGR